MTVRVYTLPTTSWVKRFGSHPIFLRMNGIRMLILSTNALHRRLSEFGAVINKQ